MFETVLPYTMNKSDAIETLLKIAAFVALVPSAIFVFATNVYCLFKGFAAFYSDPSLLMLFVILVCLVILWLMAVVAFRIIKNVKSL
jgi:uncharacterized membrane protein